MSFTLLFKGGRVAEELIFGCDNVTSGASSDIQQATQLAKAMVTKFGLGKETGIFYLDDNQTYSSETLLQIDNEIRLILHDAHLRAKKILETHQGQLERIAQGLLEYESISGSEIVDLMNGKKINGKLRSQNPSRQLKLLPLNSENQNK